MMEWQVFAMDPMTSFHNDIGGVWYTEAKEQMWQINSSSRAGSIRSVSSEISGFSDKTTSLAVTGSIERSR